MYLCLILVSLLSFSHMYSIRLTWADVEITHTFNKYHICFKMECVCDILLHQGLIMVTQGHSGNPPLTWKQWNLRVLWIWSEPNKIKGASINKPRFWCPLNQLVTSLYSLSQAPPVNKGKIQVTVAYLPGLANFSGLATTGLMVFTKKCQGIKHDCHHWKWYS